MEIPQPYDEWAAALCADMDAAGVPADPAGRASAIASRTPLTQVNELAWRAAWRAVWAHAGQAAPPAPVAEIEAWRARVDARASIELARHLAAGGSR
jgi:hypothetical protein